jgi:hypothetical protein
MGSEGRVLLPMPALMRSRLGLTWWWRVALLFRVVALLSMLVCLVDVASRNSLALVSSSGTLPMRARNLSAIADDRAVEKVSSMLSSSISATARIVAAASGGSLGRSATVSSMLFT